jgi:hypothetical protein
MKRTGKFEWTPEAEKAFAELKWNLTSPPIMVAPAPHEPLLLYITEYEGLLAGLRATNALGIKCLIVKGDSQLVVNFSNKSYTPKDEHMAAYLKEH